ncbi:hypothetical protein GCM10023150_10140 [Kangiella taiwanensis]|uniref:Uncharacterized protein n=1 Tax=Kangiella taiwanensis TaxID=1079179 RepID=A0ABP8HYI3_9GAMM
MIPNDSVNWAWKAQFSKNETGKFRFAARLVILNHEGSALAPNFWGEFFGSFFARQKMNVKTIP